MATLSSNHDWHLEGGGRRQGAESNTTGKKKASTGTLWPPRGRSKHFISQKYVFSCCALLKWKKTKTSISSNKRPNLISSTLFDHLFLAYWMEQYSICDECAQTAQKHLEEGWIWFITPQRDDQLREKQKLRGGRGRRGWKLLVQVLQTAGGSIATAFFFLPTLASNWISAQRISHTKVQPPA